MSHFTRRHFIANGILTPIAATIATSALARSALTVTSQEVEGPFYPVKFPKEKDFDLTRSSKNGASAIGELIEIEGQVVDQSGQPIEDVAVEIWQANAAGRYHHPKDHSPAPIDPNFQGWALTQTADTGSFRFKTILPGTYAASRNWTRPPHIHFKVYKPGYRELITQMYFPNHPLNQRDRLLNRHTKQQQQTMISRRDSQNPGLFHFPIVLKKA